MTTKLAYPVGSKGGLDSGNARRERLLAITHSCTWLLLQQSDGEPDSFHDGKREPCACRLNG
jgi:hypothetical protein